MTGPVKWSAPLEPLQELIAAAKECAEDLEISLQNEYPFRNDYPHMMRKFERDLDPVRRVRAALEKLKDIPVLSPNKAAG